MDIKSINLNSISLQSFTLKLRHASLLFFFLLGVGPLFAQINYNSASYCSTTYTYTTNATAYAPTGAVNCGYPAGSYNSNLSAAINSNTGNGGDDYQGGLVCGACAAVYDESNANAITVMIVDSCPSCSNGANQLDLTQGTWQALTGNTNYGILPIEWKFVPCPLSLMTGDSSGNISYEWKQCGNLYYNPIQFMDSLFPITAVGWSTSATGPFTALELDPNTGGNSYWSNGGEDLDGGYAGPYYFDVTDGRGNSVTLGPLNDSTCGINAANAQLQGCAPTATPTFTNTGTLPPTATDTFTPTPNLSAGCTYNLGEDAACTWVQSHSTDNCVSSSSGASTEAINQFYAFGGSGVSVLYCGGDSESTAGSGASSGANTITMGCSPPANATIVAAFVDVVEYNGSSSPSLVPSTGAIDVAGTATGAGIASGYGNLWNKWDDPRYGWDATSYAQTAWNVRYSVPLSAIATGKTSYVINYPNIGGNVVWSASMVIVYTVPAPNICSAVALDDGLFYWDTEDGEGQGILNEGITPFASTLDMGCVDPTTSCSTNQFSVFGGNQYGSGTSNPTTFLDQFYSQPDPPPLPLGTDAVQSNPASEWNGCVAGACGQLYAFDGTYSNVPNSGTDKFTWALGQALDSGGKQEYWVSMLAASCAASCNPHSHSNSHQHPHAHNYQNCNFIRDRKRHFIVHGLRNLQRNIILHDNQNGHLQFYFNGNSCSHRHQFGYLECDFYRNPCRHCHHDGYLKRHFHRNASFNQHKNCNP